MQSLKKIHAWAQMQDPLYYKWSVYSMFIENNFHLGIHVFVNVMLLYRPSLLYYEGHPIKNETLGIAQ